MSSKEVWFKHRAGLVAFGWPVHWKGWAVMLLLMASGGAVMFVYASLRQTMAADELKLLNAAAGGAILVLAAAFTFMAWPHRGEPDGRA
jgi:hypothetical protein